MKRFDCPKAAMERSKRMCAALNPVVSHMERAPSSEPVPTTTVPTPWWVWVQAMDEDDEQVRMATARAG